MKTIRVGIQHIDLSDDTYRIGRLPADDRLSQSIRRFGVLRRPVLLDGFSRYTVLSGFNRLSAAAAIGLDAVECIVADSVDPEKFLACALEKEYHREIGPVGKLRLAGILERLFSSDPDRCKNICLRGFSVPEQVFDDRHFREFVLGLPGPLRDYCDAKDISCKVMGKLGIFPEDALVHLARWVSQSRMKVNLFRSIVDMLDDIFRRDGDTGFLEGIDDGCGDEAGLDSYIHDRIFEVRYPEYAVIKKKADRLIGDYSGSGVSVTLPRGMDGSVIRISLEIDSRDGIEGTMKKLRLLDEKRLAALLGIIG